VVAPGEKLGGVLLVERLGKRGNSELWSGRLAVGDQVLVDLLPVKADSIDVSAPALEHANLLPLLDGGIEQGHRYQVWPYHEGVFLDRLLSNEVRPSFGASAQIARSIASALEYAHSRSIVARELCPASVLITRSGRVLIAELGTASAQQSLIDTAGRNQTEQLAYLSPELTDNGVVDARSDLFSLGAILWELIAARPLFRRNSDLETLAAVRTAEIPALPETCPGSLRQIALKLLARDPADRFADASSVLAALDEAMRNLPDTGEEGLRALMAPKKGRTFALSEASGGGAPAHQTVKSDPPSAALKAMGDQFFDAVRDGGGLDNQRFEILGRLGSGGMGEVYRVRDRELDEVIALKIIPKGSAVEMQSIERLRREVRLARRIASDHVCRIYDIADLGDGSRGLMMELIEGTTLAEMMKTGVKVDYPQFARWGAQICDGLAAAHGLSIIHRDLKPENVMIRPDGSAVILDFGIARQEQPEKSDKLTQAGIIMGTPRYMSPEQLSNRPLDGRSDLYALGLILAELITGEVPRDGASYADILDARVVKDLDYAIAEKKPEIPQALAKIIDEMIRSAASERPATASRVRDQLRAFLGEGAAGESEVVGLESVEDAPREISVPIIKAQPESNAGWKITIALLVMVLAALGFFYVRKHRAREEVVPDTGELELVIPPPPPEVPEVPDPPPPPPPVKATKKKPPDPEPM
jgi:serine/threonine protein kinase